MKMNTKRCFVFIDLGRPALWKLNPEDLYPMYLKSLPDWCILSPFVHDKFVLSRDSFSNKPHLVGIGDDFAVIRSQYIIFLVPSINSLQSLAPARTSGRMSYFLTNFLPSMSSEFIRKLRYVTKQAELPSEPGYGYIIVPNEPEMPPFPSASKQYAGRISTYELETAITADSLLSADKLPSTDSIPIHNSLILDAIQALLEGDYRRTLLYAAISMETFSATALEDSYSQSLNMTPPPSHLRISKFTLPGGHTRKKDPVFAYLAERSKTDFAPLLHEMPLYLTGKSLLVDDEQLYQRARRLYKTRNRIVHSGLVTEEDTDLFTLTFSDAKIGLQTALDVCRWFGMLEHYPLPGNGYIQLMQAKL